MKLKKQTALHWTVVASILLVGIGAGAYVVSVVTAYLGLNGFAITLGVTLGATAVLIGSLLLVKDISRPSIGTVTNTKTTWVFRGPIAQREWGFGGRRKWRDGLLLLAFFLGGIGAGQFVVSTWIVGSLLSALVGWLFVAIGKSVTHILYLGKPSRFYRIFFRPQTSWISRGLIFVAIFVVFGALYLAPELGFTWIPWTRETVIGTSLLPLATVFAFLVMIYDGFLLIVCRSIPSWRSAVIPVMFFAYSLAGGVAMTSLIISIPKIGLTVEPLGSLDIYLYLTISAIISIYVLNLGVKAKDSLRRLLVSRLVISFAVIGMVGGLIVPLWLAYFLHTASQPSIVPVLLTSAATLELAGDLSVRHSILRAGVKVPINVGGLSLPVEPTSEADKIRW